MEEGAEGGAGDGQEGDRGRTKPWLLPDSSSPFTPPLDYPRSEATGTAAHGVSSLETGTKLEQEEVLGAVTQDREAPCSHGGELHHDTQC